MELASIIAEMTRERTIMDDDEAEDEYFGPDDANLPANAHYHPGRGWHVHPDADEPLRCR